MAIGKAMKRSAASPARGNEKKKLLKRSVMVANVLKHADMPADAKKMLCEATAVALSAYADERHPFQAKVVSMAETAFNEIEAKLQLAVRVAQERIESLDENKLQNAVMQQAQAVAHLKSAAANREADDMEARMKVPKANERVKSLQKEGLAADLEHAEASGAKEKLSGILQTVEKMKAEAFVKKDAAKAVRNLTSVGVDASLLATLHGVITKPVEERGEFDALTLTNLEAELSEKGKSIDAKLTELAPAKMQRDAVEASAQEAYSVILDQVKAAQAALTEANNAANMGEDLLRTAEAELKHYAKNLKTAQEDLKTAEKKLTDFQSGTLQNFRTLQSTRAPSVSQAPEPPQGNIDK